MGDFATLSAASRRGRRSAVLACILVAVALAHPAFAALDANRRPAPADDPGALRLAAGSFLLNADRVPAVRAPAPAHEVYLQTHRPLTPADREALAALGVVLREPLGRTAHVALVPAEALDAVRALPVVRALGGVPVEDKLDAPLRAALPAATGDLTCVVHFHRDVDLHGAATDVLLDHGGVVVRYVEALNAATVRVPAAAVRPLAASPDVEAVQAPLPALAPALNGSRAAVNVAPLFVPPYNLDGTGVTVMMYDYGLVDSTHPAFGGRVTVAEAGTVIRHATAVASIVGGDGSGSPNLIFRGMADNVALISYVANGYLQSSGWLYTDPGDLEANFTEAMQTYGADMVNASLAINISNNGYNCAWHGNYGATSELLDSIANGSLGLRLPIFWAAGNERFWPRCGTSYASLPPPAGAKNVVTVGSIMSDDLSNAFFTSWGPTDDGRIKPDLVTAGCQNGGDGGITAARNGGGYTTGCGTSTSAAAATGVAALLAQRYAQVEPGAQLPSDLAKALLIQGARDLGTTGPDYQNGYGVIQADDSVAILDDGSYLLDTVANAGVVERTLNVPADTTALRVTLVWPDEPGVPLSAVNLVNDLDLTLIEPDGTTVHYPWTLNPATPAAAAVRTVPDATNNVEQVELAAALGDTIAPGAWTVRVSGAYVESAAGQRFALAWTPGLPAAPPSPATGVTLDSDVAAPQEAGTTVTWTALGEGGSGTYEYQFSLNGAVVQAWSAADTWVWDTTGAVGLNDVRVDVRNAGATASEADTTVTGYEITAPPPATGVTLDSDLAAPQEEGTTVTWTALGAGGSGTYEYQFSLNSAVVQAWSAADTWAWDTTGAVGLNDVRVDVRNAGASASEANTTVTGYEITAPPPPPPAATGVTLDSDVAAPQEEGTTVTWTALGQGGSGTYEYQFSLNSAVVQAWSAADTWAWDTTGDVGLNDVRVEVRSAGRTTTDADTTVTGYEITAPPPPPAATGVTLDSDVAAPQEEGTTVTWTAAGTGGSGTYEYQFSLNSTVVQAWGAADSWAWDTTGDVGLNDVRVDVRNAGAAASEADTTVTGYEITAPPPPATPSVTWITPPPATAAAGSSFEMSWEVAGVPDPITENQVAYGVGRFNLFTPSEAFANGVYTQTFDVPTGIGPLTAQFAAYVIGPDGVVNTAIAFVDITP